MFNKLFIFSTLDISQVDSNLTTLPLASDCLKDKDADHESVLHQYTDLDSERSAIEERYTAEVKELKQQLQIFNLR